jgi:preprotein translocase subunit SecY
MKKMIRTFKDIFTSKVIRNKILFTIGMLALYRLLVLVPVPFVNIDLLIASTLDSSSAGLGYFVMFLWGSLENFSLIAVWLAPFINASIILQLLSAVVPHLEELTEQGEVGQQKIQQYTRYLTVPLAFVQGIGMVFFINYLLGGAVIDTSFGTLMLSAFAMTVGAVLLMWIWELITEKGIANGISILIFSSIVAGMTQQVSVSLSSASSLLGVILFMLVIVIGLILLSIFILRSLKEIPVVYAKQWKVQETSLLPIPLNPVGMIPIIFAIAFITFPYLLGRLAIQFQPMNNNLVALANWIEVNLNIYSQQPAVIAILSFFVLVVTFTFFYTMIVFSPERMADTIQKRWWFIPGIRPGEETAKYINKLLMHLCLRWWAWLAAIWVYSYVLNYIPFIQDIVLAVWSLPVVITGSGVIIIVWVVQDIMNKVSSELLTSKYDSI